MVEIPYCRDSTLDSYKVTVHSSVVNAGCAFDHADMADDTTFEPFGVALGRFIREKRMESNLSQEEVANRFRVDGVDANAISQIEGGRRKNLPDAPFLVGVMRAFDVTWDEVTRALGIPLPGDEKVPDHTTAAVKSLEAMAKKVSWDDPSRLRTIETLINMWREDDAKKGIR